MKVGEDKFERLREGKLNEEQRQELVYEILKEQLEHARNKLETIRKRKKKRVTYKTAQYGHFRPEVSCGYSPILEKNEKGHKHDKLNSPRLKQVVAKLTAPHEHKGKDCVHCKIDKAQLQKAYGLEGYNEAHLDQVIENIRRINRNLYPSAMSIARTNSRGSSYKHFGSCHSGESAKERLLG